MVLLPAAALSGLSPLQLQAILAHELAHVRRHDYLVNLLQSAVETLLFYHPAVWWISAEIRAERENCCDDLAVAVCGDRLVYVSALAELTSIERRAFALAATDGSLLTRVRRILGRPAAARRELPPSWGILTLVVLLGGGAGTYEITTATDSLPTPPAVEQLGNLDRPRPLEDEQQRWEAERREQEWERRRLERRQTRSRAGRVEPRARDERNSRCRRVAIDVVALRPGDFTGPPRSARTPGRLGTAAGSACTAGRLGTAAGSARTRSVRPSSGCRRSPAISCPFLRAVRPAPRRHPRHRSPGTSGTARHRPHLPLHRPSTACRSHEAREASAGITTASD